MQFNKFNLSIIFSLMLISSFFANSSIAQDTVNNSFVGLEEIIVTAQKREQNINEVGMSIDVASGEQLENAGVKDMIDLGRLVSGFTANSIRSPFHRKGIYPIFKKLLYKFGRF